LVPVALVPRMCRPPAKEADVVDGAASSCAAGGATRHDVAQSDLGGIAGGGL